jgi:dTDP-glucose pyrophosphorylase
MIKCIIPAAGYGTRMQMSPDQSKEMLIDNTGKPVIQYVLDLCGIYNMTPLIITRSEKIDLIEYVKDKAEVQIIHPFGEWPNTILCSQGRWAENNIMILPDTRFSPTTVIADMKYQLRMGCQSVIAIHEIDEPSKWCVVEDYHLVEKSQTTTSKNAMGLIGFKRSEGNNLFKTLNKRGEYFRLLNTGFVKLETFKDITRTGKIE